MSAVTLFYATIVRTATGQATLIILIFLMRALRAEMICVFLTPPASYFKQQSNPETIHILMKPQHCTRKTDCTVKTMVLRDQRVVSVDYTTFKKAPNVNLMQQQIIHVAVHEDDRLLNSKIEHLKTKTSVDLNATALVTCKPTFRLELHPRRTM